ncbi:MAG: DUF3142 domain-containing protein [Chthoniobacteraceae bacterium]
MAARFFPLAAFGSALLLGGCGKIPRDASPLPQRAYLWQREWTPEIATKVREASPRLDGLVVLGADFSWKDGQARVLRPALDWAALREGGKPVGIAMRIDPSAAEKTSRCAEIARSLIAEAATHGIACAEFQVDFDCPDRKLAQYRMWLRTVREAVRPVRFVITALPSWLDEREFPRLASEVDGYVLQVHSVQTRAASERAALCDPACAERWVAQAAKLGRPFVVSLPTYTALVGYHPDGRSLGMALDGVQPTWPAGTRVVEFSPEPAAMARLVAGWRALHPTALTGIIWYRLPVSEVARNWRWPTFAAVMEGREPARHLEVLAEGENPVDLRLSNQGEAEESLDLAVLARWEGSAPVAAEALRGWSVTQSAREARFTRTDVAVPRLLPGSRRAIGWIRFAEPASIHVEIIR